VRKVRRKDGGVGGRGRQEGGKNKAYACYFNARREMGQARVNIAGGRVLSIGGIVRDNGHVYVTMQGGGDPL